MDGIIRRCRTNPDSWTLIKADLSKARNLLPNPSRDLQALCHYYEFVEHNELELACRALEGLRRVTQLISDFGLPCATPPRQSISLYCNQCGEHVARMNFELVCQANREGLASIYRLAGRHCH